jgi:hypothetical protein
MENGALVSWVKEVEIPEPTKCAELGAPRRSPPKGLPTKNELLDPNDPLYVFRNPSRKAGH